MPSIRNHIFVWLYDVILLFLDESRLNAHTAGFTSIDTVPR